MPAGDAQFVGFFQFFVIGYLDHSGLLTRRTGEGDRLVTGDKYFLRHASSGKFEKRALICIDNKGL
jgi:hypothetical protein